MTGMCLIGWEDPDGVSRRPLNQRDQRDVSYRTFHRRCADRAGLWGFCNDPDRCCRPGTVCLSAGPPGWCSQPPASPWQKTFSATHCNSSQPAGTQEEKDRLKFQALAKDYYTILNTFLFMLFCLKAFTELKFLTNTLSQIFWVFFFLPIFGRYLCILFQLKINPNISLFLSKYTC